MLTPKRDPKRSKSPHVAVLNSSARISETDNNQMYAGRLGRDVRMAADSTMLRMVNLFIALSLGVHLEQLEQRIGLT